MTRFWHNLSIAKKLYLIAGIVTALVAAELVMIQITLTSLSAVRAFVGGEGFWSKAQKNATLSLLKFKVTKDENDFQNFLDFLKVPEGDSLARLELLKQCPDQQVIKNGLLQGGIHFDDTEPMTKLILSFQSSNESVKEAIKIWAEADQLLEEFKNVGIHYHDLILSKAVDGVKLQKTLARISELNDRLTQLENNFSYALGTAARSLEKMTLTLLFTAALVVEIAGISITILTSRSLVLKLREINEVAQKVGQGDFSQTVRVEANDELGITSQQINEMSRTIQAYQEHLEDKVKERTIELERISKENKDLYLKANLAIKVRDDFLSVASHELKTPITSLWLRVQLIRRKIESDFKVSYPSDELSKSIRHLENHIKRLLLLIDELLDVTRVQSGKIALRIEEIHLCDLIEDTLDRMAEEISYSKTKITLNIKDQIIGHWDRARLEQIFINLISNSLKYAPESPVQITARREAEKAQIEFQDFGPGISKENQKRIFERFERLETNPSPGGLGLGLYIVKQMIQAHQGSIQIESTVGKGAKFIINLPLYSTDTNPTLVL